MTNRLISTIVSILLATAVSACGGATKPAPAPVTPAETAPAPETAAPAPEPVPEASLSEAQCGEAIDHNIALMEADPEEKGFAKAMKADRAKFVAECVEKWGKKYYECVVGAKTLQERDACK